MDVGFRQTWVPRPAPPLNHSLNLDKFSVCPLLHLFSRWRISFLLLP